jgi:caffeic acid 3-O-methyltransferase / acetylserotonin O-methyltransferase
MCRHLLKDSVLEGGIPFKKAHGMAPFEYEVVDQNFGRIFNGSMKAKSAVTVRKMLERYKGFTGINVLVDVGGGVGATLQMITSMYPQIKAINFDMPPVISLAPLIPGIFSLSFKRWKRLVPLDHHFALHFCSSFINKWK